MSGFAGVICTDGGAADERLLKEMAESLEFRGPDGTHLQIVSGMGCAFTFLRTGPSPQEKAQPSSLDGTTWLLGDVRLDGRRELIEELRQHGARPSKDASCEALVLLAWKQWGKKCFSRLQGDFAFGIWDAPAKKLSCVRDPIGPRPFFYAQSATRFYFSNTLETIRLAPDISSEVDQHFIGDFLLQGFCSYPERTAFRDIRRLPPGHLLELDGRDVRIERFGTLPIEEPLFLKRPEEYVELFQTHFRAAVSDRLPSDSAAVFLSGGMDSSSVAAECVRLGKENGSTKVLAVTLDGRPLFEDEEGMLAERSAGSWGIPIDLVSMDTARAYAGWEGSGVRTPEPSSEPFQELNAELYRRVAAHSRVVLNGEGGDAVLTGQARSYLGYLMGRGRVVKVAKELGSYFLKKRRLPFLRTGLRGKLRKLLNRQGQGVAPIYPAWICPDFERELHLRDRWAELNRPPATSEHPIHPEAYASLTSTYWGTLLEDEDAAWSGVPVETRSPFLDLRLIRFLLRVPPLPWCMEKELLREATRRILLDEIRTRPKVPLQEDPLPLLMERDARFKSSLGEPGQRTKEFVNWLKIEATSSGDTGSILVEKMRPRVLDTWLKGVEND